MPLTISEPLRRPPTFSELKTLAGQHSVLLNGNESAGDFCHPNLQRPKVTGRYVFEANGDIRGDFTAHVIGTLAGHFVLTMGKAEITITGKPLFLPEPVLKSKLSEGLKQFCDIFSSIV